MNSKPSYLDSLNAGRSRRQHASLEELNRSLEGLEARFGRGAESPADDAYGAAQEDDITRRMQKLSSEASRRGPVSENAHGGSRQAQMPGKDPLSDRSFHSLARDMERARAQESGVASISKIATELNSLREELRQRMAADAKNEIPERQETQQSVGRRWDDFGRHFDAAEERMSNSGGEAVTGIVDRLEQIHAAVSSLPESLSLHSLEEKVRTLAAAVEHFARQKDTPGATTFEAIEERLDEISRAIVASTAAKPLGADNEPFARIEARIASLSKQLEEFADDHPAGPVMDQFNALAARVEDIAGRAALPEIAIDGLSRQIASIAKKLDEGAGAPDAEFIFQGLERRFTALSDAFEQRQDDAREQSLALFRDLENRLERYNQEALSTDATIVEALNKRFADLSEAISERNEPDPRVMRGLEERLDDIASRLGQSEHQINAIDPELIRGLESQVAGLMQHLSRPEKPLPDFEDIAPRLDMIERALAESREAIINAAREAAESAIRSYSPSEGGDAAALGGLADDLQSLERLARKSDERNTRTFEAIHDTLLKVVDRLGTLESGALPHTGEALAEPAPSQLEFATAPSLDLDEAAPLEGAPLDEVKAEEAPMIGLKGRSSRAEVTRDPKRSPAEAAAAAALAALSSETAQSAPRPKLKRSKLSGLSRALTRKKGSASDPQDETGQDKAAATDVIPEVSLDAPLDPKLANQPLEPGSGAPDLNAIMKRVRDERGEEGRARDAEAAKSDFIAAARRAAQAAAAEAEVLKKKSDTKGASSGFSLKKLLRTNSKMVIVAAGVVLIGVAGMQLGKAFFKDGGGSAAKVKATTQAASSDKKVNDQTASANNAAPPKVAEMTPIMVQPDKTASTAAISADSREDAGNEQASAAEPSRAADVTPARPATVQPDMGQSTAETSAKAGTAADAPKTAEADTPMAQAPLGKASPSANEDAGQDAPATTVASADASDPTPSTPTIDTSMKSSSAAAAAAMSVPVDAGPLPLREAAQNGDPKAMFVIGTRYADGRGVASDMKAAAKWYEQSAGLGFAPAQYRIGNFYEKGLGVTRDIPKAENWYKMAADQGNASAMHNLAVLYAMGAAGKVDNESAVRWFEKAAELGVKDSQFNLGILAAKGVGMKQDLEESYKWFALVAKTGDRDAAAKRDEIANSLRPEQLQKARAATELWKAKPVDAATNIVDVPEAWKESDAKTASIDMKQAVKNIQLILDKNGYQAGTPDGIMGDKTKTAIAAFQKDNGMEATGEVNENLVNALLKKK